MTRRLPAAAAALLLLTFSCRTGRPAGAPLAPLGASTAEEARTRLQERAAAFDGLRSLMRVRATTKGRTQSFRATLTIEDSERMSLVAFTPIGTTAATISAAGEQVSVRNHLENEEWQGSAGDLGRSLGFLDTPLRPAEMAMLIAGLPPREGLDLEVTALGLSRATVGDVVVTFAPPAFPARNVVVTRGPDRIEIEHVEVVAGFQ